MRIWMAIGLLLLGTICAGSAVVWSELAADPVVLPLPGPGVEIVDHLSVALRQDFLLSARVPVSAAQPGGERKIACDLELKILDERSRLVADDRYTILWSAGVWNGIESYELPENYGGRFILGPGNYSIVLTNHEDSPALTRRGGYLRLTSTTSKEAVLFFQLMLLVSLIAFPSAILLLLFEQWERRKEGRAAAEGG